MRVWVQLPSRLRIVVWCNGNTTDFDSVIHGSNPCVTSKIKVMEEVNYKWVIGQGWVVESKDPQLKITVEEMLKEVDATINWQEYLNN